MAVSRATIVDKNFIESIGALEPVSKRQDLDSPVASTSHLTGRQALEIFQSMVESRHLDFHSRELKKEQHSFYTIGSSGHEGSAAVAAAIRPTDTAFLHYRSGGSLSNGGQVPGRTSFDVLLGIVASSDGAIAGGRHKVFGSKIFCHRKLDD